MTAEHVHSVLVVEDDPDIQMLLTTVLSGSGFDSVAASDGQSGVELFSSNDPCVVLLDVGLPVLDGWEVLSRIRESSNVPVIMLTAHGMETDREKGIAAGANEYLVKPFGKTELLSRIRDVLDRSISSDVLAGERPEIGCS